MTLNKVWLSMSQFSQNSQPQNRCLQTSLCLQLYQNRSYSVENRFIDDIPLWYTTSRKEARRFRWPRGLTRGSPAALLLGLRVRTPAGGMNFSLLWVCGLSGRGPCDGPIPRPEESYGACTSHSVWSSATVSPTPTMSREKKVNTTKERQHERTTERKKEHSQP
jgi:hypothetical protein